jgi:Tfp pilus assembly protein PilF
MAFKRPSVTLALLTLVLLSPGWGQQVVEAWKSLLQQQVRARDLVGARETVDRRIAEAPSDLEAHGWRARLLAWQGLWSKAEVEYRLALQGAPNDVDILVGLSDVLLWQKRAQEALQLLDHARTLRSTETDILVRRARVLAILGQTKEARAQLQEALILEPSNTEARMGLSAIAQDTVHELRFGSDIDTFNYTDPAQTYAMSLGSRWSGRWSTLFTSTFYARFGERATKLSASAAYRFTARDWVNAGGAAGHDNGVVPGSETFFEYGHGFRFHNVWIRGLESSYQQRWVSFRDAKVLALNNTQLLYLPRDWTWTLSVTGARSVFSGTRAEWRPSGVTRLAFPLQRRLTANTFFAVGSETFAVVDQVQSFSARTFGGGLRLRLNAVQDLSVYIARQDRSTDRTQTSFGVSYGIRF